MHTFYIDCTDETKEPLQQKIAGDYDKNTPDMVFIFVLVNFFPNLKLISVRGHKTTPSNGEMHTFYIDCTDETKEPLQHLFAKTLQWLKLKQKPTSIQRERGYYSSQPVFTKFSHISLVMISPVG